MSAKAKPKQYMILVERNALKSKNISPTPQELYDLMHLTTCDLAVKRWKWEWLSCPVCGQTYQLVIDHNGKVDSSMYHLDYQFRKELPS